MLYRTAIIGVGAYAPQQVLSNADLEKMVQTSDEWIMARTGIAARRIAAADEATSDLGLRAAMAAMESAHLPMHELDAIIVATETPDHTFPPVACQLQTALGCREIAAYDVHATCVGFLSALEIADQYIKTGFYRNILVVGADTLSRFTDYRDRVTSVLFADGAGAVVLARATADAPGIVATAIRANGGYFHSLLIPGGGSRHPHSANSEHEAKIRMDGRRIFKAAITVMPEVLEELLRQTGIHLNQIDWLIPHQANQRIIDAVAEKLGMPAEKIVSTIQYNGNNSSATIPIALTTAIGDGRIHRGDLLALVAFGGGMIWGGALVQY